MLILRINAYHAEASAAVVQDGRLLAAASLGRILSEVLPALS